MGILYRSNLLELNLRLVVPLNLLTREILHERDRVIQLVMQSRAKELTIKGISLSERARQVPVSTLQPLRCFGCKSDTAEG
jgi:hypothetical protein